MLSRIHNKLGTAGLVVAIVALVAALGGAAIAAEVGLNKKQKKEVTKIAKKFAGKPGPQGPAGTNGTNGAKGATGPKGATGEKGTNGTNGTNGTSAKGTSFTGEKTVGSVTCKEGGVEITSANPATAVCNGSTGFTSVLPKGKTETGAWAIGNTPVYYSEDGEGKLVAENKGGHVYLPFNIPLPEAPSGIIFTGAFTGSPIVIGTGAGTECTGSLTDPTAPEGKVCVYVKEAPEFVLFEKGIQKVFSNRWKSGATFFVLAKDETASGTWAVTSNK